MTRRKLGPPTRSVRIDTLSMEVRARQALRDKVVGEYAEAMREGDQFPPIVVFNDDEVLWLADGHHRVKAARLAERTEILAEVRSGGGRDALLYAIQTNTRHGLRLTAADRRCAVETLLRDEEWCKWSDREIARHCGVDHKTVGAARARLEGNGEIPQSEKRKEIRAGKQRERTAKPGSNGRRFSDEEVAEIRNAPGKLQDIARKYGTSKSQVSKIKNHQTYGRPAADPGSPSQKLPRFAALQRAWQTAEEPTRKEFLRWLWKEHAAMITAAKPRHKNGHDADATRSARTRTPKTRTPPAPGSSQRPSNSAPAPV